MPVVTDPQTATDERVVDHPDLLKALAKRQELKEAKGEANRKFKDADDTAKAMLAEFALEDGEAARCGPYRIEKKVVPGRSVSFETDPKSRLWISMDEAA